MGDSMSTIINATTTNGVVIQPDNSGSLVLQTNSGTTALTIDTSQNVGIGTATPTRLLDVSKTTGDAGVAITSSTTGQSSIFFADTDTNIGMIYYEHTNNAMGFRTNDAERMRIFSSGGVSIGNTTDPGATNLSVTGYNLIGVARYAPPQVTASVSTSATDILVVVASVNICWVLGTSGANYFLDLISARAGGEVVVLQSYTLLGSPAARTYSLPVANAKLTMASGTYRVTVTPLGLPVS